MRTNTLTSKDTQSPHCWDRIKDDAADSEPLTSFHESTTAALSDHDISALSTEVLVRLLQSIRVPIYENQVATQLEYLNRDTLERMVYLTRRYCRNRMVTRYKHSIAD